MVQVISSGKYSYAKNCIGSVEYKTNGLKGGDAGHGGFLEVEFDTGKCSTALSATVNNFHVADVEKLVMHFCGDDEIETAIECFSYLANELRGAIRSNPTF